MCSGSLWVIFCVADPVDEFLTTYDALLSYEDLMYCKDINTINICLNINILILLQMSSAAAAVTSKPLTTASSGYATHPTVTHTTAAANRIQEAPLLTEILDDKSDSNNPGQSVSVSSLLYLLGTRGLFFTHLNVFLYYKIS